MERMAKDDWFMGFALQAAKRSHDAETQVGAVLIHKDTSAILATGFNGFVRGANDQTLPILGQKNIPIWFTPSKI